MAFHLSTINNQMMCITTDTARVEGMHDARGRMCNRQLYQKPLINGDSRPGVTSIALR